MLDAARWTANDAPYLWIFAGRDAAQWRKVAGYISVEIGSTTRSSLCRDMNPGM